MSTAVLRVIGGVLVLASIACTPTRNAIRPPIQTDRDHYVLAPGPIGEEATIIATFSAPKDTAVYILHCNGAIMWGLQRLVDERWIDVWGATTNGCLSAPIVVPPGGSFTDTLVVSSRTDVPRNAGTVQAEVPPGSYRMVWYQVLTSFDPELRPFGGELPVEQRASAPITIESSRR